jgi:hypothetical protein
MTSRRSPWLIAALVLGAIVAVNLALRELDERTRSPGGPSSSSFATAPEGLAAYAELLSRFDVPVVQRREPLGEGMLDRRATLVLLQPAELERPDLRAVGDFVRRGGRLLAGGDSAAWLATILPRAPSWRPLAPADARAAGIPGVAEIRTAGEGAWQQPLGRVLVAADGLPVAVEQRVGDGTAVLLADASPLQNRLLARADNAALGLALAGDGPVVFAEDAHGYGPASGIDAIPARWWWAFAGLAVAALLFALARGRRLGPPELPGRELPPARVEFAEALATQLARKRPREDAVRTARRIARARVARRLGLPPTADEGELRECAKARGYDAASVEALLGSAVRQSDLLAVGRALRAAEREEVNA